MKPSENIVSKLVKNMPPVGATYQEWVGAILAYLDETYEKDQADLKEVFVIN